LESDIIRGAGVFVALNVKQVIEIGRFVGLKSFVGKRDNLVLNLCSILSQWRDLRTGVMCEHFGVLDTARAVELRMSWRGLSWTEEDAKTESCSSRVLSE